MASKSAAEELEQLHKKALSLFDSGQREQAMAKAAELVRALAAWRARIIAGPSDLELAAKEAPEQAAIVQQIIALERDMENALSADEEALKIIVGNRMNAIRAQIKSLTAPLREAVPGLDARHRAWYATPADLRGALEDATLLLFLQADEVILDRPPDSNERFGPSQFHAVIIPFDAPGAVINLGTAEAMNNLVSRWRKGADAALQEAARLKDLARHLRGNTIFLAADGSLAEFPFEELTMADGSSWGSRWSVRRIAGAGSLLMRRPAPVAAAASDPVSVSNPELTPLAAPSTDDHPLKFPEKANWWRRLLGKLGLSKPTDLPRQQVRLEQTKFDLESSAKLIELRRTPKQPSIGAAPSMQMKSATGAAASIRTLLELRSPSWLHHSCPWALLPDRSINPGETFLHTLHRLALTRPERTAWESPYRRGAIFLSMHRSTDQRELQSFAGCFPTWCIAKLDLQHTKAVVLGCPPHLPESGFTGDAQFAILDAFFAAGARAVIMAHTWASLDSLSRRLNAFYAAMHTDMPVREAWRLSRQKLSDAGEPARVLSAAFLAEP